MRSQLLIFEPETMGHHPSYLRHLLRDWLDTHTRLTLVVSPEFLRQHADVVQTTSEASVTWCPLTAAELRWYTASKRSLLRRAGVEWQLFCRYAKKTKADHGLIMYVDRFQLPLALGLSLPCPTSGIYFRPKLHYAKLTAHHPAKGERLHALREQWLWRRALRHAQLKTLFSLDPLAVAPLRKLAKSTQVVHLPDPVEMAPQSEEAVMTLRHALGIAPERRVFLLFGMIDRRKGIYQTLAALQQLPRTQQKQLTLLLVGRLAEADKANTLTAVAALTQCSSVQIVVCEQFVDETQVQTYFAVADVVLALYQYHVGSSGILLRAAAAGKPVLASDYGLIGELVRRYLLGITVDSTQVKQIAEAICILLTSDLNELFAHNLSKQFVQSNRAEQFGEVLWKNLVGANEK